MWGNEIFSDLKDSVEQGIRWRQEGPGADAQVGTGQRGNAGLVTTEQDSGAQSRRGGHMFCLRPEEASKVKG